MIVFNGIDIQSVADVKIEDIRVSSINFEQVTRNRATAPGAFFVRNRAAGRTVTVTFALLKQDRASRQAALDAVKSWAKTDKEYRLELPGHPDKYLMAVCTEHPAPSLRQWWEGKLRLVFSCFSDPYWIDKIEKTAACGTSFTVMGDAEPIMQIAATGTSFSLDGRTVSFSSVPSGSVLDLNAQTAYTGTTSIMQYFNWSSKWLIPRTGAQTITGSGTIRYRERWA